MAACAALGVTTAIVVPLSIVAYMDLPNVSIVFYRLKIAELPLSDVMEILLVMQAVGVVILLGAVLMAAARRRQISRARTRLHAWANRDGTL